MSWYCNGPEDPHEKFLVSRPFRDGCARVRGLMLPGSHLCPLRAAFRCPVSQSCGFRLTGSIIPPTLEGSWGRSSAHDRPCALCFQCHCPLCARRSLALGQQYTSLGSQPLLCGSIPGLVPKQLRFCRNYIEIMPSVAEGVKLGIQECQHQFRGRRWNCTTIDDSLAIFGPVLDKGTVFEPGRRWMRGGLGEGIWTQ